MMDLDAVLAEIQDVNRDQFLGALAWHLSEGDPITPTEWVKCAELCKKK